MANQKAHVDVSERRLRPVYDALDNLNNKQAIKLADSILRKQKDFHCVKALKALAFIRSKRIDDGTLLLEEIKTQAIKLDDSTLQAMTMCYKESLNPEGIMSLYTIAVKQTPGNEEFLTHLFMACVRVNEFTKQQQAAMNLFKSYPKNPYYFWAVMSTYMQAYSSNEEKKKKMYLSLAERMVEKFIKEGKIEAEEEIRLYIMILEKLDKYEELMKLLENDFKDKLKCVINEKEEKMLEYSTILSQWPDVNMRSKGLLQINPDHWLHYISYLDSFIQLFKNKYNPDKPIDTENIQPDSTLEMCESFINKLEEENMLLRGPPLALMELHKKWTLENNIDLDEQRILDNLVNYFKRFGSKPCCYTDIRQYAELLNEQHRRKLIETLRSLLPIVDDEAELKQKINLLYQEICVECLCKQLDIYGNLSHTEKFDKAVSYMKKYNKSLKLGSDLNSTEPQYGDQLVLLAAHTLNDVNIQKGDDSMLWHMLLFLEEAVECSPTYAQFKLLLIFLYTKLGAYGAVAELIDEIEIKYSMYDSLGYFLTHGSYISGQFQATKRLYDASLGFYSANRKDTSEQIIASYKYGSFRQITDMIEFKNKVESSYQHYYTKIETLYIDLLQYTNTIAETKDRMNLLHDSMESINLDKLTVDNLFDNRDMYVFDVFEVVDRTKIDAEKKEAFLIKVSWLKYRYLVLQAVYSSFHSNDKNTVENGSVTNGNDNKQKTLSDFIALIEDTVENLNKSKTNFNWLTIQQQPPSLMNLFFAEKNDCIVLSLLKSIVSIATCQESENCKDIVANLAAVDEIIKEKYENLSGQLIKCNGKNLNMFNGKSLQHVVCWLENCNFTILLITSLKEHLQNKFSKRGKRKKTQQQISAQYDEITTSIKTVFASMDTCMTSLLTQLNDIKSKYIVQTLSSNSIEELFEKTNSTTVTKVWQTIQSSYNQSLMEIIQILEHKNTLIKTLAK